MLNYKKLFAGVLLTSAASVAYADSDNEIWIEQSGTTLTLTIDQVGYGNKIGGNDFSSTASDMVITGTTLAIDIDQIGNSNKLYGPITLDTSTIDLFFTGDSNVVDWNIGYIGSADNADIDMTVTGDSNTWDFDLGYDASAESLDYDLTVVGDSNVFTTKIDSDTATWDWDVTGDSNDINTNQSDGADHTLTVDFIGSNADIDIVQSSGSCPTGISGCYGYIDLDITSDNATIAINQTDTSD